MHPILFELGPLTLRSYGLMVALGFLFGSMVTVAFNRKEGRLDEPVLDLIVWIMIASVVGARLMYVAVQPEYFYEHPLAIVKIWEGGLVFYGGLIGASVTAYFWMRKQGLPIWAIGDCVAPGLAVGLALGRVGCFLNGCCYGAVNHAHGVVFPNLMDGLPRLPTQLYESAFAILLAGGLAWAKPRRSFAGQIFWSWIGLYAIWRFFIEMLRDDSERGTLVSALLTPGQWISLVGLLLAAIFLRKLSHARK